MGLQLAVKKTCKMIHNRKTFESRDIKSFEHKSSYYVNSWINGNKKHVAEELSELMVCSLPAFMKTLVALPKDIQSFVLNSDFYKDANLHITLKVAGYKGFK